MNESAAVEILAYEKRVNAALRSMHKRTHWEPANDVTPLHHLLASEDQTLDEWGVINETARRILGWIGAEGGNPGAILRRVFALGDHMMIEPFCLLNVREKGKLLDSSHETYRLWLRRLCVDPLMRKGARNFKAPGQKGLQASAAASAAQKGNHNRANGSVAAGEKRKRKPKHHEEKSRRSARR